jgi:ParB family transcriptional regulator, chromosome partitioning protein
VVNNRHVEVGVSMTKKALGRGLDAFISSGFVRSVAVGPPHMEVAVQPVPSPAPIAASPVVATPSISPSAMVTATTAKLPAGEDIRHVPVANIQPNRFQPRTKFDAGQLHELADSIRQRGVIQPVLVRPGKYELIAGERRWRAAREVGLATIPAIVHAVNDEEALEIALIENLQRDDLNPIEQAQAYKQLTIKFGLTQEAIAEKVGRNRVTVANMMRLLELPPEVQAWVSGGQLSVGHAKAILGLSIAEEQRLVAERVLRQNLTVRETEQLVEQLKGDAKVRAQVLGGKAKPTHILVIEEKLRQKLGTQVSVHHGKKKGRIVVEYIGNDELARLLELLGVDDL